jgi:hypothetical protein
MIIARPHPTELFSLHASVKGILVYLDVFPKRLRQGRPRHRGRNFCQGRRGSGKSHR